MSNLGFRIFTDFERPSKELVNEFRELPVANIDDNMGRISAVDSAIKPYNKSKLLGPAFTVKVPQGDNLMFHKALDLAKEGDVIVVAGFGYTERALCGEIMMNYAIMKKFAGFVIDGAIRDVDTTRGLDFPVYARGVQPNGPYKNGPGEINVPVSVGGQVVFPGDIVIGDEDGLIFVRPEEAPELIEKVKAFNNNEKNILGNLDKGIPMDREWVDKTLNDRGCEIVE
ncbi:RraA family protein [Gudongella sp. DL1XJH-153]|uniref:RraA family protein n=1 Tax=Gudongella sp. DL1XJH-153 TaxID=3409804 RepID=UPI003BB66742